jgi:hypothetical protein
MLLGRTHVAQKTRMVSYGESMGVPMVRGLRDERFESVKDEYVI